MYVVMEDGAQVHIQYQEIPDVILDHLIVAAEQGVLTWARPGLGKTGWLGEFGVKVDSSELKRDSGSWAGGPHMS